MALKSLLVGMHFRPPAKWLLASLPAGTPLELRREPDNRYDEKAIAVFLASSSIPASQHETLGEALTGTGETLESVLDQPEWMLGYVAATGGKPLSGTDLAGNAEFGEAMKEGEGGTAELSFDAQGRPILTLLGEDDEDEDEFDDI